MAEDRYIKFLKLYKEKYGTVNDIKRDIVVDFEGEPLKIGEFIASIRKQHKLYLAGSSARGAKSPKTLLRYSELDALAFEWEPGKVITQQIREHDACLEYILAYYNLHKTLAKIPDKVEVEGKILNIKSYMSHRRANHRHYLAGKNIKGSCGKTELRRYQILDSIGFVWNPESDRKEERLTDDKPMRFIEEYYQKHQAFEGLPNVVTFEGQELNIRQFLNDRRKQHRKIETKKDYIPSELEVIRQQRLQALGYDFDFYEKRRDAIFMNDKYLRYLESHYRKYGTINNIKSKEEVEFEGEVLKIGPFLSDCRKNHALLVANPALQMSPLVHQRLEQLTELGLDWTPSKTRISLTQIARENGVSRNLLRKYTNQFNGDYEKALKICLLLREQRLQRREKIASGLSPLSDSFEIDEKQLETILNTRIKVIKKAAKPLMYSSTQTLREYCIQNRINYGVIYKAIKARREGLEGVDLEKLIEATLLEYKIFGQQTPSTWIYSKYGGEVLVRHLLTSLGLDIDSILYDMSNNFIDIEEAIENDCFRRHSTDKDAYLKGIYQKIVAAYKLASKSPDASKEVLEAALKSYIAEKQKEFSLTASELKIIVDSVSHYREAIHQYHLYDVGFDKSEASKQEKIRQYNLSDDDIEEAFYMPLKFDEKILLGEDSVLYKRRLAIRGLTMAWNHLSETERAEQLEEMHVSPEEQAYIARIRRQIDTTKQLVKKTSSN